MLLLLFLLLLLLLSSSSFFIILITITDWLCTKSKSQDYERVQAAVIDTHVRGDLAWWTPVLTRFIGHFHIHTPVALQVSVYEGSVNGCYARWCYQGSLRDKSSFCTTDLRCFGESQTCSSSLQQKKINAVVLLFWWTMIHFVRFLWCVRRSSWWSQWTPSRRCLPAPSPEL